MMNFKTVFIGDGAVGKTCFLFTLVNGTFPNEYVPTVFDNFEFRFQQGETYVHLQLWDTAGAEDYDKLRPLSYPGTDVFAMCYSLADESSLERIAGDWFAEIACHCPFVPKVLIGMKSDLQQAMTDEKIEAIAAKVGADASIKCSSRDSVNLHEVAAALVQTALKYKHEFDDGSDANPGRCLVQ